MMSATYIFLAVQLVLSILSNKALRRTDTFFRGGGAGASSYFKGDCAKRITREALI